MAEIRAVLRRPLPYLVWLGLSALVLVSAQFIDPYVFAFTAMGTAWLSGALAFIAAFHGWRAFLTAVLAGLPTLIAFLVLGTYRWH